MTGPIDELDTTGRVLLGACAAVWLAALGTGVAATVALAAATTWPAPHSGGRDSDVLADTDDVPGRLADELTDVARIADAKMSRLRASTVALGVAAVAAIITAAIVLGGVA